MLNKKILFYSDICNPQMQGGVETFGRVMEKMFTDVTFMCYEKTDKKLYSVNSLIEISIKDRFNLYRSDLYTFNLKKLFLQLLNILTKEKILKKIVQNKLKNKRYDFMILHSPQNLKFLDRVKSKKILVQHNCFDKYIGWNIYYNNESDLIEKSKNELDCFVFLSEDDRDRFIKELKFDISKTEVIRHSCEIPLIVNKKIKNKNLVMIGRLSNFQKRMDLAIRAMKKLEDFTLNIYGDGPSYDEYKKIIEENGIKNVILHGSTNEVQEKLDENSIFIMTSDFEGYPISTIEAMRRGLPIILRDRFEAAHDIIVNNGVLLSSEWNENEFVQAVRKIYDNYEFYSDNSIELGKRHDFEKIKKDWENLFVKLRKHNQRKCL